MVIMSVKKRMIKVIVNCNVTPTKKASLQGSQVTPLIMKHIYFPFLSYLQGRQSISRYPLTK